MFWRQKPYWLYIGIVLFFGIWTLNSYAVIGTWDLNRTIGWDTEYNRFMFWFVYLRYSVLFLFILAYFIVNFIKKDLKKNWTIAHFVATLLWLFNENVGWILIGNFFLIISLLLFIINLAMARKR